MGIMNFFTLKGRLHHSQAGVSLVEVMLAAAIMAIVLTSILAVAMHGFRYVADMPLRAQSSQFLQEQMENVRLMTWGDVLALPSTFDNARNTGGIFSGTMTKSTYQSFSGSPIVIRVTATATWSNSNGRIRTNSMTSLVSNGGLNTFIY